MVCTKCSDTINIITRRKCSVCSRFFCSKCLQKAFTLKGTCSKCVLLKSGRFTQQHLKEYTVKELKNFLKYQNMSIGNCVEKEDLVNLVFRSSSMFTSSREVELLEHQRRVEHMKVGLGQKLQQSVRQEIVEIIEDDEDSSMESSGVDGADDGLGDQNDGDVDAENVENEERERTDSSFQSSAPQVSSNHHSEPIDLSTSSSIVDSSIPTAQPPQSSTAPANDVTTPGISTTPSTTHQDLSWLPPPPSYQQLFKSQNCQAPQDATSQEMQQQQTSRQQQQQPHSSTAESSSFKKAKKNFDYIIRLEQIEQEQDIQELSIKQLKIILANNFVTCKGCCEKNELSLLVLKLFKERLKNLQTELSASSQAHHADLCKICMEHVIDCVLLECGHMVSCTECSKRLHQCPICRSLVSRVVHIFKA